MELVNEAASLFASPMSKMLKRPGTREGGALLWVLVGCVMVAILFFVLKKPEPRKPKSVVIASATPAPATPAPATPAPVVPQATPTPLPVPVATPPPAPTPPALDLATIARTPALWPKEVALVHPIAFPISYEGRIVGEAKAPAGTLLRLWRVSGQQVEVQYRAEKHLIPAASTDLTQRALVASRTAGSLQPATPQPAATPARTPTMASAARIGERMAVDIVRMKKSRIEGGDWDDKTDRIELKVKLTNRDISLSADNLKGEIYIFAESILDRSALKLLAVQNFEFSLSARGTHERVTDEVVTTYDTTGGRFGYKYEGWLLRIRDQAGSLVLLKSSSPSLLKNAEKISTLTTGSDYDRVTFKEKAAPVRSGIRID